MRRDPPAAVTVESTAARTVTTRGLLAAAILMTLSCSPEPAENPARKVPSARAPAILEDSTATRPPNILVYLVDTLRSDRLSTYGYELETSPNLDRFAQQATVFEDAVAQSSWTRPSVVSLFTGLTPLEHGVQGRRDRMAEEVVSIAEILQEQNYATAGFVANPNVRRAFGLAQGFDVYRYAKSERAGPFAINRHLEAWLAENQPGERPIFLYMHSTAPHSPYEPDAPFRERFVETQLPPQIGSRAFMKELARAARQNDETVQPLAAAQQLLQLYDAEIAWNDAAFGEFLEILEKSNLLANSLIVFLSDHGEEFYEHGGWEHSRTLHDEVLRIPLVVRFPGQDSLPRTSFLAQHIDFVPTVLTLLDQEIPEALSGRSWITARDLVDATAMKNPEGEPSAFSFLDVDGRKGDSITTADWKLIRMLGSDSELYDRTRDRLELAPTEDPQRHDLLMERLSEAVRQSAQAYEGGEAEYDAELEEQLREMGYIE